MKLDDEEEGKQWKRKWMTVALSSNTMGWKPSLFMFVMDIGFQWFYLASKRLWSPHPPLVILSQEDDEEDEECANGCKIVGLRNYGQSCFLNTVLQALAACWKEDEQVMREFLSCSSTTTQFIPLLQCLNGHHSSTLSSLDPRWILKLLSWNCHQPQDAHECFQFLLEHLCCSSSSSSTPVPIINVVLGEEKEEEKKHSDTMTNTTSPFTGTIQTTIICTVCQSVRVLSNFETFVQYSLSCHNSHSIQQCLQQDLEQMERLSNVECHACSIRQKYQECQQEERFYKNAHERLLQKKSQQEEKYHELKMEYERIHDEYLFYKQLLSSSQRKPIETAKPKYPIPKPISQDAWKCMKIHSAPKILCLHLKRYQYYSHQKVATHISFPNILPISTSSKETIQYQCIAVIEHIGRNSANGHYVTYRRLNNDDEWAWISDEHIQQPLSWNQVSQCQAYMLFYKQI